MDHQKSLYIVDELKKSVYYEEKILIDREDRSEGSVIRSLTGREKL